MKVLFGSDSIIKNFSWLALVQMANALAPMIVIPYLIKVGGAQEYGELVLFQSIAQILVVLVSYGFDITGVKSAIDGGAERLSVIVGSILACKLFLVFMAIASFLCIPFSGIFGVTGEEYKVSFSLLIGSEVLNFAWLYLALEKLKLHACLTLVGRTATVVATFLLVKTSGDLYLSAILQAATNFGIGSVLLYLFVKEYGLTVDFRRVREEMARGLYFFLSRLMVVIRERGGYAIIGAFLEVHLLTIFDVCCKLLAIAVLPISVLNSAIYPRVLKARNYKIVYRSISLLVPYAVVMVLLCSILGDDLLSIVFSIDSGEEILIIIMSALVPQVLIYFFGNTMMVPQGMERQFNISVIFSSLLYLAIVASLAYMDWISIVTVAVAMVLSYWFVAIYRFFYVVKSSC